MNLPRSSVLLLIAAVAPLLPAACGNPAVDDKIAAFGPEDPNVAPGEYHRPGQPCVLCHGKYADAEPLMSIGGTIYAFPPAKQNEPPLPVKDVKVTLTDSFGESRELTSNCAGNFFIKKDDWDPAFPLRAEIDYPGPGTDGMQRRVQVMVSRISRDGSCAGCHLGPPTQGSPGWVICSDADVPPGFPPQDPTCPGAKK